MPNDHTLPRVVIVGAGFAGLYAAKRLARQPVRVTVIDRKNHHTFQPLLYQVATAALSPADIAAPVRQILRGRHNLEVLLGEVSGFDLQRRSVQVDGQQQPRLELNYDFLIVAAGATHAYFGHEQDWAPLAPGLKTIEDATEIRRRILLAYELAEREAVAGRPSRPLNFVVVGGGPTGVELAGALVEIARKVMNREFRGIDPSRTRVILLEAGPRVLAAYPEDLSRSAEEQLRALGVEVRTNSAVSDIKPGYVMVGEEKLETAAVLWGAGVAASPLGRKLGAETDRAGRALVAPDLTLPGHPEVFVVGDLASLKDAEGKLVPGVAPAAIQMGKAAADNILACIRGEPMRAFRYNDKGTLATIGRAAAVADIRGLHLSGLIAWLAWLFIHIFFLIGFRNRVAVLLQWAWAYATWQRAARLITGDSNLPGWR
jgi:NADH:ubiquinone reductase (H+-translocating)